MMGSAPKLHLRDARTIRRVLMGEWAKNGSRLQALQALNNLEERYETLRAAAEQVVIDFDIVMGPIVDALDE